MNSRGLSAWGYSSLVSDDSRLLVQLQLRRDLCESAQANSIGGRCIPDVLAGHIQFSHLGIAATVGGTEAQACSEFF